MMMLNLTMNRRGEALAEKRDHRKAPLYERLIEYAGRERAGFHVPGHNSGAGAPWGAEERFRPIMEIDLTELPELDDLHAAEGVIREAQTLAADAFGAGHTFFLVGGSTAGNLAMIMSLCGPGDLLIVQRDVHKSVIHGLMLARCRAVFLAPRIDPATGLSLGVEADRVEEALRRFPEAKGVLVTNPSYYGAASDLRPVVETAHAHGKPVLVDEAHGAHFAFHPDLPPSAMSCGADAAVQSAHKMLNAMTMGAMLHVQGDRLDRERLGQLLAMVQSSSPSYPIMASLDLCRRDYALRGEEQLSRAMAMIRDVRSRLAANGRFRAAELPAGTGRVLDPFKMALHDSLGQLNGYRMAEELSRRGIAVEMADPRYALLVLNASTPRSHLERLEEALRQLEEAFPAGPPAQGRGSDSGEERAAVAASLSLSAGLGAAFAAEPISDPVSFLPPAETAAAGTRTARIPVEQCAGRISAEMIIPYPPGIPLLYRGECIHPAARDALLRLGQARARVQGASDAELRTILVYDL
jgi:arginine/lysine/ornithine decarboxylase